MNAHFLEAIDHHVYVELNDQHIQVLDWLYRHIEPEKSAVQWADLLAAMGICDVALHDPESKLACALVDLEKLGCIAHQGSQVMLLNDLIELPVIGQVAAGTPIEAIENHDDRLMLPLSLFRQRPTYLLKVRGDSMRDIGIADGDIIAVRKTETSGEGKIVVARVNNDVTVKRLKFEQSQVALMPENSDYEPILVAPEDLVIEGEFVGLIRTHQTVH